MEKKLVVLEKSPLFKGITAGDTTAILGCLGGVRKKYQKGEYIYNYGDKIDSVGLVLTGGVDLIEDDYWGNQNIIAMVEPGETFGEAYACVDKEVMGVTVQASAKDTEILFLNIKRMLTTCSSACVFHAKLLHNLVGLIAAKNLQMHAKLSYLVQRSTRKKLLAYLHGVSKKAGALSFTIPFNRQQLADYLSVDRSALSSELAKMQSEGLLQFEKNNFSLSEVADVNHD